MKITPQNTDPIPWARPAIDDAELKEVVACMNSGWLTSGPRVEKFERLMAVRAGRKHAIAVSNGTAALELALRVLGITTGDEVIVPALSYVATASAVALQGATPVFADVDAKNLGLNPRAAEKEITPRTRAILCTDHGGNPCNYAAMTKLAKENKIPLIVDGAQSIGSCFDGKPTLSYGVISTTSFHAAKMITTVEGGMVFTDDATLDRRMRMIRSQGEDPARKYHHVELGHNFRMTELQAAIGLAQMAKLDTLLEERQHLAANYDRLFAGTGWSAAPGLDRAQNSYFLYLLVVPDRDEVMARLKQRGIDTRACYPMPLYAQPIFRSRRKYFCPVAERTCAGILNPPMFHGLTGQQQDRIAGELKSVIAEVSTPRFRKAV